MDNKLKKNIIYNALYQALVILLPILTMPYLVRTLSKEQIGINSYSLSVVQIFIVISFGELIIMQVEKLHLKKIMVK